jgi:hypothetical protein
VIDGESAVLVLVLPLSRLEASVALEMVLAAWAAIPTPTVPARLAAIKAPVMTVVRLRPWSRSMFSPSCSLTAQSTCLMSFSVTCGVAEASL